MTNVDPVPQPVETRSIYWGPWSSLAFALGIFAVCDLLVPLAVGVILMSTHMVFSSLLNLPSPIEPWVQEAGLISLMTPAKLLPAFVLFFIVAWWRGVSFTKYFAVRLPAGRTCAKWFLATVCLIVLLDLLRVVSGRPIVPEWVATTYTRAPSTLLLFVTIVLAAPLYEELLFRGLLLPGLANSRLGALGSVAVTAAVFAVIHLQYDAYDMLSVFVLGGFLCAARLATDSTGIAILIHMLFNLTGFVEAVVKQGYFDK